MNLVQTPQYLEDLEVSDGSENDSDLEIEHQDVTKIFIQPPIDSNEINSDVDSGDKEDPSIDNLSGNQLLAPVSLVVKDVKKGGQQKKDPGGSNCSNTGSKKKKSFEKSWEWKRAGQEEGERSKRNSCGPMRPADDLSRLTFPEPV